MTMQVKEKDNIQMVDLINQYNNIKIGKDHQLKTVKQVKAYDYMFDKRMVYCENENLIRSFPYGY